MPQSFRARTTYIQWELCRYCALFYWVWLMIYGICEMESFSRGHYTHSADWYPGGTKDINPACRRPQTVNQIFLNRYSQQKCFLWFPFPIANCNKIFMSYSQDWITQLIYWKTYILDIKINLQYSIPLWAIIASRYKGNGLILSRSHSRNIQFNSALCNVFLH